MHIMDRDGTTALYDSLVKNEVFLKTLSLILDFHVLVYPCTPPPIRIDKILYFSNNLTTSAKILT